MNVKLVPIIEIINSSGTVLFKYPQYTLLDKIVDVWKIIIKYYYDYRPFAVGNYAGKYEGYRLITHEECKSPEFVSLFSSHCKISYGIMALDKIERSFLYNNNKALSLKESFWGYTSIQCWKAGPGDLTRLCSGSTDNDIKNVTHKIETGKISPDGSIVGLFVLNDLFFPFIPDEIIPSTQKNNHLYLDYQ